MQLPAFHVLKAVHSTFSQRLLNAYKLVPLLFMLPLSLRNVKSVFLLVRSAFLLHNVLHALKGITPTLLITLNASENVLSNTLKMWLFRFVTLALPLAQLANRL